MRCARPPLRRRRARRAAAAAARDGEPDLPEPRSPRVARGAVKALLDEPRLPDFEAFCAEIRAAHAASRAFAVHCVTRAQGLFAAAAFRDAGARRGDRLEHASVAPPELVALAAELGLAVVTQPHFLAERGDDYAREVDAGDLRGSTARAPGSRPGCRSPRAATRPTARPIRGAGSRPPWHAGALAAQRSAPRKHSRPSRRSRSTRRRLAGGPARGVAVGADADLCLLDRPWRDARARFRAMTCARPGARENWYGSASPCRVGKRPRRPSHAYPRAPRTFAHHWRSA